MSTGTLASPAAWPDSLTPDLLRTVDVPTPYLATELDTVAARYRAFTAAMPWASPFYAMKRNPSPEMLDLGGGFPARYIADEPPSSSAR
jgi:ornithine decarboxylase